MYIPNFRPTKYININKPKNRNRKQYYYRMGL